MQLLMSCPTYNMDRFFERTTHYSLIFSPISTRLFFQNINIQRGVGGSGPTKRPATW
jgi:hypothetical protein